MFMKAKVMGDCHDLIFLSTLHCHQDKPFHIVYSISVKIIAFKMSFETPSDS